MEVGLKLDWGPTERSAFGLGALFVRVSPPVQAGELGESHASGAHRNGNILYAIAGETVPPHLIFTFG